MAINFNNQNRGIGTLDLTQYGLMQPETTNMQVAGGYDTPTEGQYGFNLIELDRLKRAGYDPAEVSTYPNKEDVQSLIRSLEPTAMAISNYDQLFGPRTMTDANQSLYTGVMDQLGNPVDLSNRNINTTEPYQDLIMNPDYMPNRLQNLERFADNRFEDLDFQPGFNFKDAPNKTSNLIESYQNRSYLNNPNRGIIDNLILSRGNPDASLVNRTKDMGKKGFNIGKQALLSGLGFATGIPLGILGMLPERDYRQNVVEDFYSDPNTRGLVSRIPGMENYNTVSGGLLNALTGGKMGEETTYGLGRAIDKRMARIQKTLDRQKKNKSKVLQQRLKDLQALKDREAKALADARAKQSANLESQRRGRRPGSGGDGPGTKDSGGPTGGYSYDSGGRKGFGYGL
jgi:hypothetical protein